VTTYRLTNKQKEFEQMTGVAVPKPVKSGEIKSIQNPKSLDAYVLHLTTMRNLFFAPGTTAPNTGILKNGLDPTKGGGPGGACETCKVLNNQQMLEGSIKNSRNVVAVNTAASNLKLYANQRHEHTVGEFQQGNFTEEDLVGTESILLRFKLQQKYVDNMIVDPQHPTDEYVRLIKGVRVPVGEIEALLAEGWVQLSRLSQLREIFAIPKDIRSGISRLSITTLHIIFGHLGPQAKAGLKSVLSQGTRARIARVAYAVARLANPEDGKAPTVGKRNAGLRAAIDEAGKVLKRDLKLMLSEMRTTLRQNRSLSKPVRQDINAYANRIASVVKDMESSGVTFDE
jgi:hypothetical protein